jgi:hypothetical protein
MPRDSDYIESVIVRLFAGSGLQEGAPHPRLAEIMTSAADAEITRTANQLAAL